MELRMVWTNFFLVLWLLLFIPFFGLLNQPPLGSFTDNFWKATKCVFTGKGGEIEDNCKQAGWILGLTIPVAALQAHSQIVLSRDDTGLFATLALSCAPFLADLAFPFKIIMGQYVDPVSHWDFLAAGLCLVGVLLYAVMEHFEHRDTQKEVDDSKFIKWFSSLEEPKWLPKFLKEKKNPKKEEETLLLKLNDYLVSESP
jgi:hypothetical protein